MTTFGRIVAFICLIIFFLIGYVVFNRYVIKTPAEVEVQAVSTISSAEAEVAFDATSTAEIIDGASEVLNSIE